MRLQLDSTDRAFLAGRPIVKGYEQITALSTVKTLDPPEGASLVVIQAEAQNVRWRDDGDDPTASVGMVIPAGQELIYDGSDLTAIRFIETAASAKLNVAYYA